MEYSDVCGYNERVVRNRYSSAFQMIALVFFEKYKPFDFAALFTLNAPAENAANLRYSIPCKA
jgi:hypothetical protein